MSRTRGRRARWTILLPVTLLALGVVGVRGFYPAHVEYVTGRSDPPQVSCLHCHVPRPSPRDRGPAAGPRYLSPEGLAASPDGDRLYVTAEEGGWLLEVDLRERRVRRRVELPGRPHGVAISPDGERLAVSCRDSDRVVLLDAATLQVMHHLEAGPEPLGLAFGADASELLVAAGGSDDLILTPADGGGPPLRLAVGNEPYALARAAAAPVAVVAARLAWPVQPGLIPESEVTLVDTRRRQVAERRTLSSAHLSEGVAIAADGSFALAAAIRVRNLLPLTQVARGAVMSTVLALLEVGPGGRTVQFPLDETNAFFADPAGVVLTPDGRTAFIAHGGAAVVTAVDVETMRRFARDAAPEEIERLADDLGASAAYVRARIPTRENPRGLALSPDGATLYVAERLADTVAMVDVASLAVAGRIDLGGPAERTAERRGAVVFHDGGGAFQGQFSCRSCHPDGHTDGLIWDFEIDGPGVALLETRSLRGIRDTAPFKWNGKNPDLATQCGPRFARVLTRTEPFPPDTLRDLVAYIESIPVPPVREAPALAETRERGRAIFFRTRTASGEEIPMGRRCDTCHRPPLFTDRLKADVGTGGAFDTPHLFDLSASPPYLHDGRALTLEEIWTVHSPDDTHGAAADLSKVELNDLVTYLRSL